LKFSNDEPFIRSNESSKQIVLPSKYEDMKELDENRCHLDTDRVNDLTCQHFLWPLMKTDIEHLLKMSVIQWSKSDL